MLLQAVFLPGFNDFFLSVTLLETVLKWLFVIGFGMYVVFAFIIIRQIQIMRSTLITPFSPLFTVLGYVHLVISIVFFLFVFLFL